MKLNDSIKVSKVLLCLGFAVAALALSSCQTPEARYIDSKGSETVVSLDQINIQDWTKAADEMVASLLQSPHLKNGSQSPAVLAISRIINNTSQLIDTDLLTKKIRIALNRTGKVMTTTTIRWGDTEDPLAKEYQNQATTPVAPDFTLSGKILEDRARANKTRQTTYIFQLSLTDTESQLAVWEDEQMITKQGQKASIGW